MMQLGFNYMKSLVVYLRTESALTASQNYVKFYYMVRNLKCLKSIPTTNSFSWVCKSLFILYIGITLLMTHMTSDLVSKIFLTLVSKILFILFILYRPTLLTRRFDIFDNVDWQPDPLLCCVSIVFQYWMAAYTEVLSLLSQGNEMNRMNVWCAVFQFVYIFPWPSISFIAHFSLYPMISCP